MKKLNESKRLKNTAWIPAAFTPRIPDNAKMDPLTFLLLVPGSQPHSLPVFLITPRWIPCCLPENLAPGARIPAAFTPRIPDYAKMDPLLFT
jgi:hypothetical protein